MTLPELSAGCCSPVSLNDTSRTSKDDRLIGVLKALADPTRLDVLRLIAAQSGPICVCHIVERFDVSQPTISHHLRILRQAGLVEVTRSGGWAYYRLSPADGLRELRELSNSLAGLGVAAG